MALVSNGRFKPLLQPLRAYAWEQHNLLSIRSSLSNADFLSEKRNNSKT